MADSWRLVKVGADFAILRKTISPILTKLNIYIVYDVPLWACGCHPDWTLRNPHFADESGKIGYCPDLGIQYCPIGLISTGSKGQKVPYLVLRFQTSGPSGRFMAACKSLCRFRHFKKNYLSDFDQILWACTGPFAPLSLWISTKSLARFTHKNLVMIHPSIISTKLAQNRTKSWHNVAPSQGYTVLEFGASEASHLYTAAC